MEKDILRTARTDNRVAIVTGGGQGIGLAVAKALAKDGAAVVIGDIDEQAARTAAEAIRTGGGRAISRRSDVTVAADARALVEAALNEFGRLDCAVNNAGITLPPIPMADIDDETWDRLFAINVTGVRNCMRAEIPQMLKAGGGSIVNTSSLAAFLGTPALSAYGASKGAVRQFTKTVAMDCARKGYKVRCNSVHPGIILTPMGEGILGSDKARERALRTIPIGEFGAPEDIAYGILYLISDESRFVTGSELVIDGGMNAI